MCVADTSINLLIQKYHDLCGKQNKTPKMIMKNDDFIMRFLLFNNITDIHETGLRLD